MNLDIKTPRWALPLLKPSRYKGAKGGRGSGKSHFFAELIVEQSIMDKDRKTVCIREVQKSLKYSAKSLIEAKIKFLGLSSMFEITQSEIRRIDGDGLIIFQGMQDHTADSIKSLEGFDCAWVEEAQNLSARSLRLLRPTIRKNGSEIWFSWNPENSTDAVDKFLCGEDRPEDAIVVHVNYNQNPFLPQTLREEMELDRNGDPEIFKHIWLGGYNEKSDSIIFAGKYKIMEFDVDDSFGDPLHGLDFGFAQDPTAAVRLYVKDKMLYIRNEAGKKALELDDTSKYVKDRIPGIEKYSIRADNARPESISYLKRNGLPKIEGVKKWPGSIEDGISFMRSFQKIIIHPDCKNTIEEFMRYSYKVDKRTGDVLPDIIDTWNHYIDATRYALAPLIKGRKRRVVAPGGEGKASNFR